MIQTRNKPTFLRKLYPITKLWMAVSISLAVIFFHNVIFSMAVLLVSVVFILTEKYYLEFKIVAFTIITLALSMFLINGTLNPVGVTPAFTLPLVNWVFHKEGLEYALTYFQRIAPLMACLFLLFRTMNMTDLGVAMNESGLSYRSSFIFISTFQLLPILNKEMNQIMDAQRARGLDTDGNILKRAGAFIPVMVPVVSNSIMKIQQQATALETKGFNSKSEKTVYRDLEKTHADVILKWVSIALGAVSILYFILGFIKI